MSVKADRECARVACSRHLTAHRRFAALMFFIIICMSDVDVVGAFRCDGETISHPVVFNTLAFPDGRFAALSCTFEQDVLIVNAATVDIDRTTFLGAVSLGGEVGVATIRQSTFMRALVLDGLNLTAARNDASMLTGRPASVENTSRIVLSDGTRVLQTVTLTGDLDGVSIDVSASELVGGFTFAKGVDPPARSWIFNCEGAWTRCYDYTTRLSDFKASVRNGSFVGGHGFALCNGTRLALVRTEGSARFYDRFLFHMRQFIRVEIHDDGTRFAGPLHTSCYSGPADQRPRVAFTGRCAAPGGTFILANVDLDAAVLPSGLRVFQLVSASRWTVPTGAPGVIISSAMPSATFHISDTTALPSFHIRGNGTAPAVLLQRVQFLPGRSFVVENCTVQSVVIQITRGFNGGFNVVLRDVLVTEDGDSVAISTTSSAQRMPAMVDMTVLLSHVRFSQMPTSAVVLAFQVADSTILLDDVAVGELALGLVSQEGNVSVCLEDSTVQRVINRDPPLMSSHLDCKGSWTMCLRYTVWFVGVRLTLVRSAVTQLLQLNSWERALPGKSSSGHRVTESCSWEASGARITIDSMSNIGGLNINRNNRAGTQETLVEVFSPDVRSVGAHRRWVSGVQLFNVAAFLSPSLLDGSDASPSLPRGLPVTLFNFTGVWNLQNVRLIGAGFSAVNSSFTRFTMDNVSAPAIALVRSQIQGAVNVQAPASLRSVLLADVHVAQAAVFETRHADRVVLAAVDVGGSFEIAQMDQPNAAVELHDVTVRGLLTFQGAQLPSFLRMARCSLLGALYFAFSGGATLAGGAGNVHRIVIVDTNVSTDIRSGPGWQVRSHLDCKGSWTRCEWYGNNMTGANLALVRVAVGGSVALGSETLDFTPGTPRWWRWYDTVFGTAASAAYGRRSSVVLIDTAVNGAVVVGSQAFGDRVVDYGVFGDATRCGTPAALINVLNASIVAAPAFNTTPMLCPLREGSTNVLASGADAAALRELAEANTTDVRSSEAVWTVIGALLDGDQNPSVAAPPASEGPYSCPPVILPPTLVDPGASATRTMGTTSTTSLELTLTLPPEKTASVTTTSAADVTTAAPPSTVPAGPGVTTASFHPTSSAALRPGTHEATAQRPPIRTLTASVEVAQDSAVAAAKESERRQRTATQTAATGARAAAAVAAAGVATVSVGGVMIPTAASAGRLAAMSRLLALCEWRDPADAAEPELVELPFPVPLPLLSGPASEDPEVGDAATLVGDVFIVTLLTAAVAAAPVILLRRAVVLSPIPRAFVNAASMALPAYFAPNVVAASALFLSVAIPTTAAKIFFTLTMIAVVAAAGTFVYVALVAPRCAKRVLVPHKQRPGRFAQLGAPANGPSQPLGDLVLEDTSPTTLPFVSYYGPLLDGVRDYDSLLVRLAPAVDVMCAVLVAAAFALPSDDCTTPAYAAAAVALAYVLYLVALRPYRGPLDMVFVLCAAVLQLGTVAAICYTASGNGSGDAAAELLLLLSTLLLLVHPLSAAVAEGVARCYDSTHPLGRGAHYLLRGPPVPLLQDQGLSGGTATTPAQVPLLAVPARAPEQDPRGSNDDKPTRRDGTGSGPTRSGPLVEGTRRADTSGPSSNDKSQGSAAVVQHQSNPLVRLSDDPSGP